MRIRTSIFAVIIALGCAFFQIARAAPPFSGTIFIDPDIITEADPTTYQSTVSAGRGNRRMFDRRVNGWVYLNAYLFEADFNDGLKIEIQVNPEFGSARAAQAEARKYAPIIGRLPSCLRAEVATVWIHQGVELFGGGNNNLLIHTGQAQRYWANGILEEVFVHEASHSSLDRTHASAPGWLAAQLADPEFISTYARENRSREDIAESFLVYLAVRYRPERISQSHFHTIFQTIPHRIAYFDRQDFDMHPIAVRAPLTVEDFTVNSLTASWTIRWVSRHGKTYALDASTDLNTWEELMTNIPSQGARTSVTQANVAIKLRHFFRVRELDGL